MRFVRGYLIPRFIQYILVTFLGLTATFFLAHLMPMDPIQQTISQYRAMGAQIPPEDLEEIINTLKQLYGVEGSLWQQYLSFWKRLFTGNFGPSLSRYPTTVTELIGEHLPWTLGLLIPTTVLGWLIGILIGGVAGYHFRAKWTKVLDGVAMLLRPIPYYIMALLILILFAYVFPVFPLSGGMDIGQHLCFSLESIRSLLWHWALPALSLIIGNIVSYFQMMKLIVQSVRSEDYVRYAKAGGVKEGTIAFRYVIRNAMLPTITQLGLTFGQLFSGALITEMVFAYPGIGWLLYDAVMRSDYNLIMGIACISIIAVTTSIFILDLVYPLIDPRIRYQ